VQSPFTDAMAERPLVLDGGLATRLEARGHDLSSDLWSARLLTDAPEEIVAAHRDFFNAGAVVATTASYQASFDGLSAAGIDRAGAEALIRRSVELAARARDGYDDGVRRWVAASVGPYGAALADGSEYSGDYGLTVAELRAWHRPRLAVLAEAGPDVLALETIPSAAEVEALLAELDGLGLPAWLSVTAAGGRTRTGEPLDEVFRMAVEVDDVVAVGVNCCPAEDAIDAVTTAVGASGRPGVVYPNSGEVWDAVARRWTGPGSFDPVAVDGWLDAGARLVGGCCRVTPEAIAGVAGVVGARTAVARRP
jgi:homocysteine S-methyltransferase